MRVPPEMDPRIGEALVTVLIREKNRSALRALRVARTDSLIRGQREMLIICLSNKLDLGGTKKTVIAIGILPSLRAREGSPHGTSTHSLPKMAPSPARVIVITGATGGIGYEVGRCRLTLL